MKKLLLIATVLMLYGCPGNDDCDDLRSRAEVYDLVKLGPLQNQITQGSIITLSLELPSTNSYFGSTVNLFEQTGDNAALLIFTGPDLFIGNEITFVKGFLDRNVSLFGVVYNPMTQNYELEIEIKLNKLGVYELDALHFIEITGRNCNRFGIDTSTEGTLIEDISFEVVP